jgi:hypothetical protein
VILWWAGVNLDAPGAGTRPDRRRAHVRNEDAPHRFGSAVSAGAGDHARRAARTATTSDFPAFPALDQVEASAWVGVRRGGADRGAEPGEDGQHAEHTAREGHRRYHRLPALVRGIADGGLQPPPGCGQPALPPEQDRLGEELATDLAAGRAERPPRADGAAFEDGDEHHVGDPAPPTSRATPAGRRNGAEKLLSMARFAASVSEGRLTWTSPGSFG